MPEIARITFNKFYGGVSFSDKAGIEGAYAWGQSLDHRTDPKKLQLLPKTTQGTDVFADLPLFMDSNTVNTNIYALGNAGKVYKKSGTTWSLLSTLAGGNGEGLKFFAGTGLYYGSSGDDQFTLDPSNDSITEAYRSLNTATWHPAETFLDKVFTGNGREIISTDASAIDYDSTTRGGGITLDYGYSSKVLKDIGNYLFIGATCDNSSRAKWFLWDGFSDRYNQGNVLGEDGINAANVADDGTVLIHAGKKGNIYKLVNTGNGFILDPVETIPNIEDDKYVEVYPGATTAFQGRPYFAPSYGDSATVEKGAYCYARSERQFPKVLTFEHIASDGTTTGTTFKIGCLYAASSTDMYLSWDNNGTYGMDLIDGSGVYATGQWESIIFDDRNPFQSKTFTKFKIKLARVLRTGEKITLKRKADRASSWTEIDNIDFSVAGAVKEKTFQDVDDVFQAHECQFQLLFTITGSTSPEVDSLMAEFITEGAV